MPSFAYRVKPGRPPKAPATPHLALKGEKFGHLTVLEFLYCKSGKSWWSCLCDCGGPGSQILVRSDKLTGGQTKSCKCGRGYARPGVKPSANPQAPPARTRPPLKQVPTARAVKPAVLGFRKYTREELAATEALNASQMKFFKVPASEITEYLALSRPGGPCTYAGLLTEPAAA